MENASRALIMAGGVLISLLVVSLLVFAYRNLSNYMSVGDTVEVSEQVDEFNKQFDVYYRNGIYGSEILSLANKVIDYNTKYSDTGDYLPLEVTVKITKQILTPNNLFEVGKTYNSVEMSNKANSLDKKISEYDNIKYKSITLLKSYSVVTLSSYRTKDLEELNLKDLEGAKQKISEYLVYKNALTTLKSSQFKAKEFKYDTRNGRITAMNFEQTK